MGIPAEAINKIGEGSPHVVDWIERGEVDLVINTPVGTGARTDGYEIRSPRSRAGSRASRRWPAGWRRPGRSPPRAAASPRCSRCRRSTRQARLARSRLITHDRVQAPFGRRPATVTAREQHGAYVVLRCADAAGPRPQAGQFYMLAAATRWGGGEGERPFLPRAFSVLRAPDAATTSSSS